MSHGLLQQLARQTRIEGTLRELEDWAHTPSANRYVREEHTLVDKILTRSQDVLAKIDAPLVVATFGGTGVGKSSLTNALVGADVAPAGRQRPTTRVPTLLAHPDTLLGPLGLPETSTPDLRVVRTPLPLLKQFVLLDCPDPDTDETDELGTNIARLRELLPRCDVLIVASTQEQYLEARVNAELLASARHCRLIFVQTRADIDDDIRDDWKRHLGDDFQVQDIFFVDSRVALAERQRGLVPSGEFGRLTELLEREFVDGARSRIRQHNVLDLSHAVIRQSVESLRRHEPQLDALLATINRQNTQLVDRLAKEITHELQEHRSLWERRLLDEVTTQWGMSPFSALLGLRSRWSTLLGSWAFLRSRTLVQATVVGGLQAADWYRRRSADREATQMQDRLPGSLLAGSSLPEVMLVTEGFARDAGFDSIEGTLKAQEDHVRKANELLVADAAAGVDSIIRETTSANAGPGVRFVYESLFLVFPLFLLYRIAKNFFFDALFNDRPHLDTGFYIPAAIFLALWCGLFLWLFSRRVQRGLTSRIQQFAAELPRKHLPEGLFPELTTAVRTMRHHIAQLEGIGRQQQTLLDDLSHDATQLAGRRR